MHPVVYAVLTAVVGTVMALSATVLLTLLLVAVLEARVRADPVPWLWTFLGCSALFQLLCLFQESA